MLFRLLDESSDGGTTGDLTATLQEQLAATIPDETPADQPEESVPAEEESVADSDGLDGFDLPPVPEGSILHRLREEYGTDLTGTYRDDNALIAAIPNQLSHIGKIQGENAQLRQALQYYAQQQQAAPQQAAHQTEQPQNGVRWQPPVFNPDWQVFLDDEQKDGISPQAPPEVRKGITDWANFQRAFRNDPRSALEPLYQEAVQAAEQRALARVQQLMDSYAQDAQSRQMDAIAQQQASAIFQQRLPVLAQKNSAGQPLIDPATGFPVLNPAGHFYVRAGAEYRQRFISRYGREPLAEDVDAHAMTATREAFAAKPRTQQPPPETPRSTPASLDGGSSTTASTFEQQLLAAVGHRL